MIYFYFGLGLATGALGTLIGAGGGFILVPLLLTLMPTASPAEVTAISLCAISANACSGSLTYLWQRKVVLKAAFAFLFASIPGTLLGAELSHRVDLKVFHFVFAVVLIFIGIYLLTRSREKANSQGSARGVDLSNQLLVLGMVLSFGVGMLASFLGIGGGIIHVPLLSQVLGFPVHLAVGTSHFILALSAVTATFDHWRRGDLNFLSEPVIPIAIGMTLGAQIGAQLSHHIKGVIVLRLLGGAAVLVGLRFLFM